MMNHSEYALGVYLKENFSFAPKFSQEAFSENFLADQEIGFYIYEWGGIVFIV